MSSNLKEIVLVTYSNRRSDRVVSELSTEGRWRATEEKSGTNRPRFPSHRMCLGLFVDSLLMVAPWGAASGRCSSAPRNYFLIHSEPRDLGTFGWDSRTTQWDFRGLPFLFFRGDWTSRTPRKKSDKRHRLELESHSTQHTTASRKTARLSPCAACVASRARMLSARFSLAVVILTATSPSFPSHRMCLGLVASRSFLPIVSRSLTRAGPIEREQRRREANLPFTLSPPSAAILERDATAPPLPSVVVLLWWFHVFKQISQRFRTPRR